MRAGLNRGLPMGTRFTLALGQRFRVGCHRNEFGDVSVARVVQRIDVLVHLARIRSARCGIGVVSMSSVAHDQPWRGGWVGLHPVRQHADRRSGEDAVLSFELVVQLFESAEPFEDELGHYLGVRSSDVRLWGRQRLGHMPTSAPQDCPTPGTAVAKERSTDRSVGVL